MASMSILDDAIREHLELKRAHGADESEVKKLEDEAFGPPQRPDEIDPFAEAPTEFLGMPEAEAGASEADQGGRRMPNIADIQEAPEQRKAGASPTDAPAEAPAEAQAPEAAAEPEAPVEELQPSSEQALPDPADLVADAETEAPEQPENADPGPDTQERHAIADQPTELFDVEAVIESEPDATTEARSPSDEDLADAEAAGPRLSPVEPLGTIDASATEAEAAEEPIPDGEEDEDDFFSEQRLSDELDQALEAPVTEEHPVEESSLPVPKPEADEEGFEDEPDEEDVEEEDEPVRSPEPAAESEQEDQDDAEDHEDVLEDTPEFLEDAPEDDNLWFEQRPPNDFDFDD
jgi:hypothetical protein